MIARADYAYRSGAAYNDRNSTLFHDYSMINAGLTYEHGDGNWSVSVYGKNLTDTAMLDAVIPLPFASFGGSYMAPLTKGRRFGAEVRFNF
ncbi:MAG: TonB-dependent receptor [Emcibacter sp.]|nr:TonB-dependent receptor [Emcibacter sp.]